MGSIGQMDPAAEARLFEGVRNAERFFMTQAPVHAALTKLTALLEADGIPYALVGAMALNEHGVQRVTTDVHLLLTAHGLAAFKRHHLGKGYADKFSGSRGFRDTENRVDIDVVITGEFPGDGKPKPIAFPDPAAVGERGARVRVLPLPRFIELEIASGMTAPHRLRDLADILDLIRIRELPRALADDLDPYVREKFLELWVAAQTRDPE